MGEHLSSSPKASSVLYIVFSMMLILAVAGTVVAYVAYPRRGVEVPHARWLGEALGRGVKRLPTLARLRAGRD
jgi:hypothetical protein